MSSNERLASNQALRDANRKLLETIRMQKSEVAQSLARENDVHQLQKQLNLANKRNVDLKYEVNSLNVYRDSIASLEQRIKDKEIHYNRNLKLLSKKNDELAKENRKLKLAIQESDKTNIIQSELACKDASIQTEKDQHTYSNRPTDEAELQLKTSSHSKIVNSYSYSETSKLLYFEGNSKLMKYANGEFEFDCPALIRSWKDGNVSTTYKQKCTEKVQVDSLIEISVSGKVIFCGWNDPNLYFN